jgi:hypothetical protein
MPTATKRRRLAAEAAKGKNGSRSRAATEFPPGSLEADLSVTGKAVPPQEWANLPADYFANLDRPPKKK